MARGAGGADRAEAERVDAAEEARPVRGDDDGGDGVPASLRDPTRRAQRIAAAAAEVQAQAQAQAEADRERRRSTAERLERALAGESVIGRIPRGPHRLAEARAHLARAIARQQAKLDRRAATIEAGKRPLGRPAVPVDEHPYVVRARKAVEAAMAAEPVDGGSVPATGVDGPKMVANVGDPQSRLMPTRKGFVRGYNAQVAVTADQVIVAVQISQNPNDIGSFVPMMQAAQAVAAAVHAATDSPEHVLGTVLADAGYASHANTLALYYGDRIPPN